MANETEQTILIGQQWNGLYRDRYAYERDTLQAEAIRAWRLNPLARRLANLYKIYNIDGIKFQCDHPGTQKFIEEFWNHDLNRIDDVLEEISNELFLTGNLFVMFNVDSIGMTYIRVYPTDQIADIVTAENDLRQEVSYVTKQLADAEGKQFHNLTNANLYMQHYSINRLAGTCWGEGEIYPDLPWLGRYASWLEDRVRLNRYRSSFMYVVQGTYASKAEKEARQRELNANPPRQGSILVTDPSEQWGIMSPNLDAFDSSIDGMAIKKMLAVNHAPMHYLAEPESSTRTTADAAGSPAFKGFENHQEIFKRIILRILTLVVQRRAQKDSTVSADAKIEILAGDISERDNAGLALATGQMVQAIGDMYDRELIEEDEYLRLVYRFAGETRDANLPVPKGIRKPVNKPATPNSGGVSTNTKTGDVSTASSQ
jgi:hypothetical protein